MGREVGTVFENSTTDGITYVLRGRDERAPSIFDHQQQSSAGFFPWLPVLTIWTVDTQDNDARWKGASWVTRFLRELEEDCHGVQGLGGLGMEGLA